jgi:hypothetical protein
VDLQAVLREIGNILIWWAAIVGTASVVVHARVRWWDSEMGRHLMVYMTVIAAVLVLSVIRTVVGDSWWFQLLRTIVFIGVPFAMTQRLWLQIKAQRLDREEREARRALRRKDRT